MSRTGHKRLALTLYRSIFRWSNKAEEVPFQLRFTDVQRCAPEVFERLDTMQKVWQDAPAVRDIAREAFRNNRDLVDEEDVAEALDQGLDAVQLLHTEYTEVLARLRSTREVRADRGRVHYSLGQVLMHRKFGYRGVVVGWDRECERDAGWAAAVSVNPHQPFYHVLPDEDDCQRIFGAVRISKYVAQDNAEPLAARRVNHRAIAHYFDSYSPDLQRYIPNRRLQFEYPDNYAAAQHEDCLQDSNILGRPEQLHGSATDVCVAQEQTAECGREF